LRLFHAKKLLAEPSAMKKAKKIPRCVNIWAGGKEYCGHPVASGFLFFISYFLKFLASKLLFFYFYNLTN